MVNMRIWVSCHTTNNMRLDLCSTDRSTINKKDGPNERKSEMGLGVPIVMHRPNAGWLSQERS